MTEHKREYMKKYRDEHKDYGKEYQKNYYLSHKEQYAEQAKLYRQRNKEKYREQQRRSYYKNKNNPRNIERRKEYSTSEKYKEMAKRYRENSKTYYGKSPSELATNYIRHNYKILLSFRTYMYAFKSPRFRSYMIFLSKGKMSESDVLEDLVLNKIVFDDKDEAIYLKTISSYCSRKGEQITK